MAKLAGLSKYFGKHIVCPFCFEYFGMHQVAFRCLNSRCSGFAPDQVYADASGEPLRPMGRVLSIPEVGLNRFKVPKELRCDLCGKSASRQICPHCHSDLPVRAGEIDNRIIAIVGGRRAGKSHYIATLFKRIENEVGMNFGLSFLPHGDVTLNRFTNEFLTPLYEHHQIIDPTQSVKVTRSTMAPLRFRLTASGGAFGIRELYLTFFDSAGEDMASFDTMSAELKYIAAANAIVFVLDPLQMQEVRDRLQGTKVELPRVDTAATPSFVIQRVRDLFEERHIVSGSKKIDIPVAIALSKIDALFPLIDSSSELRRPGEHFGKVNNAEIDSVHTEIMSYLGAWNPGFLQQVDLAFSNYRFFGVSSLGKAPSATGHIDMVSPIRVEDPMLWMLKEFGIVGSEKGGH